MKFQKSIARHPVIFAVATLLACLGVYSAVAATGLPPFIPPAIAAAVALAAYWVSRPILWAGDARKRDARVLALAAIGAAVVVSALGIALGAFEPHASDIPLVDGEGTGASPIVSLLAISAVCVFTGIYEEAAFSAVLFGALRIYYARDDSAKPIDSSTADASNPSDYAPVRSLSRHMFGKAAAVQGLLFAFAHIVTGLVAAAGDTTPVMAGQMAVWFIATFLFGVVTAVLMEYGRSLALNAVVHASYDFALFGPLALKTGTMRSATITGDATDLVLFAAQACILAIILVAFYAIARRRG